jgi:hypothetical protein
MRWLRCFLSLFSFVLMADRGSAPPKDPAMIDEFSRVYPAPLSGSGGCLWHDRMANSSSLGQHFRPRFNVTRDFVPENPRETKAVAAMEDRHIQLGLYLVGRESLRRTLSEWQFRAMKEPAAITDGTPRPAWYPIAQNPDATADALPDWNAICPVAQKAMRSFEDGGAGFETTLGNWQIAARPVPASQERCRLPHGSSRPCSHPRRSTNSSAESSAPFAAPTLSADTSGNSACPAAPAQSV